MCANACEIPLQKLWIAVKDELGHPLVEDRVTKEL
jgi:hypothetical protein